MFMELLHVYDMILIKLQIITYRKLLKTPDLHGSSSFLLHNSTEVDIYLMKLRKNTEFVPLWNGSYSRFTRVS